MGVHRGFLNRRTKHAQAIQIQERTIRGPDPGSDLDFDLFLLAQTERRKPGTSTHCGKHLGSQSTPLEHPCDRIRPRDVPSSHRVVPTRFQCRALSSLADTATDPHPAADDFDRAPGTIRGDCSVHCGFTPYAGPLTCQQPASGRLDTGADYLDPHPHPGRVPISANPYGGS